MKKQNEKFMLNDTEIKHLCEEQGMISQFVDKQIKEHDGDRIISYGLGSFGYDIRMGSDICYPTRSQEFHRESGIGEGGVEQIRFIIARQFGTLSYQLSQYGQSLQKVGFTRSIGAKEGHARNKARYLSPASMKGMMACSRYPWGAFPSP